MPNLYNILSVGSLKKTDIGKITIKQFQMAFSPLKIVVVLLYKQFKILQITGNLYKSNDCHFILNWTGSPILYEFAGKKKILTGING